MGFDVQILDKFRDWFKRADSEEFFFNTTSLSTNATGGSSEEMFTVPNDSLLKIYQIHLSGTTDIPDQRTGGDTMRSAIQTGSERAVTAGGFVNELGSLRLWSGTSGQTSLSFPSPLVFTSGVTITLNIANPGTVTSGNSVVTAHISGTLEILT